MAAFTQAAIAKLLEQRGKREVVKDPKTVGLRAELREGGAVSFYLLRRIPGGKPVRIRIGSFPDLSVDQARTEAAELIARLARGENVAELRRKKRNEPTLKELFEHWLRIHAKPHKKRWRDDVRMFDKYLVKFHGWQLSRIQKADVAQHHAHLGKKHGPYQANRVLALLRAVLNHADDLGYDGTNPAEKVKPFKETERDRFLQPDELPRFFGALAQENELFRDFFLLAIFTGARRGNVASMEWAEVDLDQAAWRIPDTKPGRVHFIPLSVPAVEILNRRRQGAKSRFVFPGRGKTGHLVEVKTAWARILARAELSDIRPHDLRRTLGSYAAIGGASLTIIGKMLGHSQPSATKVYARLTDQTVANTMESTAKAINKAAKPNPSSPVTSD